MKRLIPVLGIVLAATAAQSAGHPFDASRLVPASDSFVIFARSGTVWRPVGGLVQTIARDTSAIRVAVDYAFPDTKQRVEMAMHPRSLGPLAHWETLSRRGLGDAVGEVLFRDGRAKGAFILSKSLIDIPIDSGIVDDDASTVLLAALPLDSARDFSFRTFASPGELQVTRVRVEGIDTVTVPAGTFAAHRLLVMSRDTSHVYISTTKPRRIVLVRLGNGTQEMRLINARH